MSFHFFPKGAPISKRILDLLITIPAFIFLSPIMLLISMMVAWQLGFPILFRQKRPGYQGKIFTIYKFRTMRELTDSRGNLLPDKKRLTKFGMFLRKTSLDELPELFNVLKGEMSIVGPRPLLIAYLPLYDQFQIRRHNVLPGITGWAQINGRNALTWQKKFELDVWYVDHWSLWLDVKIIVISIIKVLRSEGISQPGQATAEPFKGNTSETETDLPKST